MPLTGRIYQHGFGLALSVRGGCLENLCAFSLQDDRVVLRVERIGVVTSGGDAPGMNAAIRAVVRIAGSRGVEVVGFERGYEGLIANSCRQLGPRSVSGIIHLGGTILHTARCERFKTDEGLLEAAENLRNDDVGGLVVIGGDGSLAGALDLSRVCETPIVGVPASIDNDIYGTDETIGFDTAVNTAVSEVDKIRDTAISHERVFVVEVMGRERGFLALAIGLTVGAESILVPEVPFDIDVISNDIMENHRKGKKSAIIVAAEGVGDNRRLTEMIAEKTGFEVRLSILGYVQRGGNPTARSRLLASLFGEKAVRLLMDGRRSEVVSIQRNQIFSSDLEECCRSVKPLDESLLKLANELAV